jgi:hypothetical protein
LLAWRNGVKLECFLTNVNTITAWCYSDPPNHPWMLSCIYGSPYASNKLHLWENITKIGTNYTRPWLCIGDFNMILNQIEKMDGLPNACSSQDFFRTFLNLFGMVDLGFFGNPFTWSNHREGISLIKQRLDRGIASTQWIYLFPFFSILHLPALSSDHNLIILDIATPNLHLPRPFRFEEFWTKHPDCRSTILAAWDSYITGSPAYILSRKLKSTKAALKIWNNLSFGNIQHKINSLSNQIDIVQNSSNFS